MNQMSHESHARMKQHQNAQQQQQQHQTAQHHHHQVHQQQSQQQQQQHLKSHIKEMNSVAELENHQNSIITHTSTTSPNHMNTNTAASTTPSTTGTSPDLMNYQTLTISATAPNGLNGASHIISHGPSPKPDHSHSHSGNSPYSHHANTQTTNKLMGLTSNISMTTGHHTHLNLNLNSQVVPQQTSPTMHHNHSQVMGTSNLYSTIGQAYATDNSSYGPIYHHHNTTAHHYHGHAYGTPYDKLKATGHMRPTHNITNGNNANNVTHSPNSYAMSSYQSFYGSPHQMMRPAGYIDLVPR